MGKNMYASGKELILAVLYSLGFETQTVNSTSDSSDSLNSGHSNHVNTQAEPTRRVYGGGTPGRGPGTGPIYSNINVSELGMVIYTVILSYVGTSLLIEAFPWNLGHTMRKRVVIVNQRDFNYISF